MVMVGAGIEVRPGRLFAVAENTASAVAWATESDCVSIAGLMAAIAAASVAAFNCDCLRKACV